MKVLKDNYNTEDIFRNALKINCMQCGSELEITEEDTHISWLGARFITCPCCGEETLVDELDGITLTKDNLEFPKHFNRTTKGLRNIKETCPNEIVKIIKSKIENFRHDKDCHSWYTDCHSWYTSWGDTLVVVFRCNEDKEYHVVVAKDYYETDIPFEELDY